MAVIGTLRQRLGGVLIVVIALAMLAFIFMDLGGSNSGASTAGNDFAKVNGESISYAEYSDKLKTNETNMIRNMVNQGQLQPGQSLSAADKERVKEITYNEMLGEKLKENVYRDLGIQVGPEEKNALLFDDEFRDFRITQSFSDENGLFNAESFSQYIKTLNIPNSNSGLTVEEQKAQWMNFESSMYQEKADSKYNTLIAKSAKVPTWMATTLYNGDNAQASIEYVYLPFTDVANDAITLTDADLNAYIKKNSKNSAFKQEEAVSIKYVSYPITPSSDDVNEVQAWMNEKMAAWQTKESDSLFIMASSETRWDPTYYTKNQMVNQFSDSLFASSIGSYFGPVKNGNQFMAYKLIDRKQIPDSVKVSHLVVPVEGLGSRDEYLSRADSLFNLVSEDGVSLSSLIAQYPPNPELEPNVDKEWISYGTKAYSNEVFFQMKKGSVQLIETQTTMYLVEVNDWGTTSTGVKVAELKRSVFPSETTTNNLFSEASIFSGNNRTLESFVETGGEQVKDAPLLSKKSNQVQGLKGNGRSLIKWAFDAELNEVSAPEVVGDNFVVAVVTGKFEKGVADLENVRAIAEAGLRKEKAAEILKAKMSGSDLSAISSANSKAIQTAANLSMSAPNLPNIGNEPKVAGAALGLEVNGVSKPIVGENGVFVIKTTSKTDAPPAADLSPYTGQASTFSFGIQSKLFEAMKDAAKIEDNSFDFY